MKMKSWNHNWCGLITACTIDSIRSFNSPMFRLSTLCWSRWGMSHCSFRWQASVSIVWNALFRNPSDLHGRKRNCGNLLVASNETLSFNASTGISTHKDFETKLLMTHAAVLAIEMGEPCGRWMSNAWFQAKLLTVRSYIIFVDETDCPSILFRFHAKLPFEDNYISRVRTFMRMQERIWRSLN